MLKYDLCIIGGGPAGMMAALRASERGKSVVLIEKNKELGLKLLLTGGGRCNLTHAGLDKKDFALKFGKQGDFLLSPLSIFGVEETIDFFNKKGLSLKIEADGKVYPKSEKSKDVLDFLKTELKKNKVKILTGNKVSNFIFKDGKIEKVILDDEKQIFADNFLIATGGKSYPQTGSTGNGYNFAKRAGHSVTELKPALSPVETKEKWVSILKGISLEKVGVSLNRQKPVMGDVLFTHFGLSGPIILNLSENINTKDELVIDLFPKKNIDELEKKLIVLFDKEPKKTVFNALGEIVPMKLLAILLNFSNVKKDEICRNISKGERKKIVKNLKNVKFTVIGVLGFEKAMITKGGISLKEIDSRKMRSKIIDNLYFAGEVIDLNGESGGFNLQMCFTTGYVVAESI
ncbi:MAG: NAD(P)/FAD-dependent oxidoreductase [Minisyncoccales bacterium]|jgi:predicted Rossmann fold flavoprotein